MLSVEKGVLSVEKRVLSGECRNGENMLSRCVRNARNNA